MLASDSSVRITELFHSLQGESTYAGLPTVFVRLTGCPLRCVYCDTAYAFQGGEVLELADVLSSVQSFNCKHVCVTGGEPLAQPGCVTLLSGLCEQGCQVSLETSGAMDISAVDKRVKIIMDLKAPASAEQKKNDYNNIDHLKRSDEIKFVLADRGDYDWALDTIERYALTQRVDTILFSPVYGQLSLADLSEWILQDRAPVRMQMQLHKIIWGEQPGR